MLDDKIESIACLLQFKSLSEKILVLCEGSSHDLEYGKRIGGYGYAIKKASSSVNYLESKQTSSKTNVMNGCGRMDGRTRKDIYPGLEVFIVLKKDQRTGKHNRGVVKNILTKSSYHPHGIKVRLEDGKIGRVQEILS